MVAGQFHTAWAGPGRHKLVYLNPAATACTPQDTVSLVVTPVPDRILSPLPVLCRLDTTVALQA